VAGGAAGKLAFKTRPCRARAAIAELGVEPREFAAGGLERAVKLQRLPEVMTEHRMALRRSIKLRPTGDTRLYIRVPAGGRPPHLVQPDLSVQRVRSVIPDDSAIARRAGIHR
jgi:hypothetical protein